MHVQVPRFVYVHHVYMKTCTAYVFVHNWPVAMYTYFFYCYVLMRKAWEGRTQTSPDSCVIYDAADCIAGLLLLPVELNHDEEGPPSNGEK